MSHRVLVVEDEANIADSLSFLMKREGYAVQIARDGETAVRILEERPADLVILDVMLPRRDGFDVCRRIREMPACQHVKVMMLTAKGREHDRLKGIELGADDYVTKPFAPKELVARIEAVLRRMKPEATNETVQVSGLLLDPVSHRVTADERDLDLAPTEFRLLHVLMTHPERVYSRDQLLDLVWGRNIHVGTRTVDMHVSNLRKALESSGHHRLIQTVHGAGYRFSTRGQR